MANSRLLRKIYMDCPLCDKSHEIEERIRTTSTLLKDEETFYEEKYYVCNNGDEDENEFETGQMMNENMMAARNAYRVAHNLLTAEEIVEIRKNYSLTQVELAKLLGWGEATISRYESKAIQDEAYDHMLRMIKDNPLKAIEFLDKNRNKFPEAKRRQIREKMEEKLDAYGKEFLARQDLKSKYVRFAEPSDANGFKVLDIDKIEHIVSYYAKRVANLYKTKLMKMLWYADALYFQIYESSMTGLVYRHEPLGALPVGHYSMMNLENINFLEEEEYDSVKYHFYPNEAMKESMLQKEEIAVLDKVVEKFKEFNAPDIVNYMHEESAYLETNPGDIISYEFAKQIRDF